VSTRRAGGRAFVVSEHPLVVLEVRPPAIRLLDRLPPGEMVTLGVKTAPELRFLRRLADLGLLELRPAASVWPPVTVVVPVRNRPRELADCLVSLTRVCYQGPLEVVVVDDASDPPAAVPEGIRLIRLQRPIGPAGARNAGAAQCCTDLVAFLDSDCIAEPDWLESLVPELADPAVVAAGGRVLPTSERSWLERYEAVRSPLDLGPTPAAARPKAPVPYLVTANLVVRRSVFEATGGFDPALRCGEDVDLCWRLYSAGHRLAYQPAGRVHHRHRGELTAFAETRAAYAASEASLLRRHPHNGRWLGLSPGMGAALSGALAAVLGRPRLLLAGGIAMGLEVAATSVRLKSLGVSGPTSASALIRGQGNGFYHVGRQLARYYGLPATMLALAAGRRRRGLLLAIAAAELTPAVLDWWRLRPRLTLPAFVAAGLFDDAAYQVGLLIGCLRQRSAAALGVELRLMTGQPNPER
jgi:mycofactocin glycosyltransferase